MGENREEKKLHDFNWKVYLKLNPDLDQNSTERQALYHYIKCGIYENRRYKNTNKNTNKNAHRTNHKDTYEDTHQDISEDTGNTINTTNNIPSDFDWKVYVKLHSDLDKNSTEEQALFHYINYGIKEGRKYKSSLDSFDDLQVLNNYTIDTINKFISQNRDIDHNKIKKILNHSVLFNKYILGISKIKQTINYDIILTQNLTKNICHIHCFKLSLLELYFKNYIDVLSLYFDIIITYYIKDTEEITKKYNKLTYISSDNIGADIGCRFLVYDYLNKINYNYNYIFYIHSKSNDDKRNDFLIPFMSNIANIYNELIKDNTIGGIFNNILQMGDDNIFLYDNLNNSLKYNTWTHNQEYMDELTSYFNVNKNNYIFNPGSFLILNKKIIDILYSDTLLYGILNNTNSFEYQWVKKYYKLNDGTQNGKIENVFNIYKQKNMYGNNFETKL